MVIPFSFTFKTSALHKYVSVSSFLKSEISAEMYQVALSFQNSVKVTNVIHFFNFKCVLQIFM